MFTHLTTSDFIRYSFLEPYFFHYVHVENPVDMWIKDRMYGTQ